MTRGSGAVVATLVVAFVMVTSVVALPLLGGSLGPDGAEAGSGGIETAAAAGSDGPQTAAATGESASALGATETGADTAQPRAQPRELEQLELVSMEPTTAAESSEADAGADASADARASLSTQQEDAVEAGVDEGIELVQSQGVEVSQEQRAAAIEGASESVVQHQEADVEQVQEATKGAVHGSLIQGQQVEAEQVQYAVGGATDGALAQYQSVSASQMQSATWGATHGAIAQSQSVTVEQLQVATRGAAAGAASEAGDEEINETPTIQEAAQGAAYGVLAQYQQITVEQRQQVTLEHVQHAAAGASSGALEGGTEAVLEQEQRVEAEQYQRVTIKQTQKAAMGAAKGALVQRQEVTVEQTQAAARGASAGSLKQVQSVTIEQVQRISVTQIQEASFGAAKGSIIQSQEATVEQIQAAADGAAGGVLVQQQEISITQIQYAAVGASQGSIASAIQYQIVEVEQIQAAAFGAGEGAVIQKQIVSVTQVQKLATGGASGALIQHQEATVEQIQIAASSACQETARVVQYQRISITQIQILTQETASEATAYAIQEGITDEAELSQFIETDVEQRVEEVDELEGEASVAFADQEGSGETVTVDSVELSEGGFVAIYEGDAVAEPAAVVGVSDYLEAGEHTDVEIELEDSIEAEQSLVAVVHHDTTGDETFQYAETDGSEDDPYVGATGAAVLDTAIVSVGDDAEPDEPDEQNATLEVSDQEGDGESLVVDEASADSEYTITAAYDGEVTESDSFEANESATDLELDLEPPIENTTSVDVAVLDDEGNELENETIEYSLTDEPPETDPQATLNVSNQTGDGETLVVDEANASSGYTVTAAYDGTEVESETFDANETATDLELALEPPIENSTSVDVAVIDSEGGELENETIEYTLEEEPPETEPEATLNVSNQTGDGENLTVDEANASVPYALTVTDENGEQRAASDTFAANESVELETLELEPPLEENATLDVAVVSAEAADGAAEPDADATADAENGTEAGAVLENETIEYSVDSEEPFEAAFVDCQRAEVTGSFEDGETIIVATGFYESGGFGNTMGEYAITVGEDLEAPFEGSIVYETGDEFTIEETADGATVTVPEGDFGAAITGFASPDATPGQIDNPNPDASACVEEVRPELPTLSVEETTPTEDGIEVTFGYENPNNASLLVGSEFVEGTTDDVPVDELEPGTNSFTVEWTPANDDERLVWAVDMSTYDYDEDAVEPAQTATAGEIDPSDPAEFSVAITETNDPVVQGEPLEVTTEIENVGGEDGTQDITLSVGDTPVDVSSVSLEPGATEAMTLSAETADLEPGEYPVTVSSENEILETTVTIDEPEPEEAEPPVDDPAEPTEPQEPAEPTEPEEPAEPTDPEPPAEPPAPEEGESPDEPAEPGPNSTPDSGAAAE